MKEIMEDNTILNLTDWDKPYMAAPTVACWDHEWNDYPCPAAFQRVAKTG